jgi:hypothetical protein
MSEEAEDALKGCRGEAVSYEELDSFLEDAFSLDDASEADGLERFSTCIWGQAGIGKTSKVKAFQNRPVFWDERQYPGYKVVQVPVAQFEEMGDLHGLPSKHVRVTGEDGERWVPTELAKGYVESGWTVDHEAGLKMLYAPPDWVPSEPGPCIFLIDDWNRASIRIIKGIMQLLQDYGMMSWKLPAGCHIVLTGNPDDQDYLVTSTDAAILTRLRHVTLKEDPKEWSVWAETHGVDARVISFILAYPEMMRGKELTNPRTISQFGRYLKRMPQVLDKVPMRKVQVMAHALIDPETVSALLTYIERDFELVVSPDDILAGKTCVQKSLSDLMNRKEKRVDVVGVICDRLYARLANPEVSQDAASVKNVQKFLTCSDIPSDMRYNLVTRMNRAAKKSPHMEVWYLKCNELLKLIMEVV